MNKLTIVMIMAGSILMIKFQTYLLYLTPYYFII